jgi:hypothetical protein
VHAASGNIESWQLDHPYCASPAVLICSDVSSTSLHATAFDWAQSGEGDVLVRESKGEFFEPRRRRRISPWVDHRTGRRRKASSLIPMMFLTIRSLF